MKPCRFRDVSRVLLAVVASLWAPKAAFPDERWLRLTSANFELFTTEKEKGAREAILYFEQVRSFFLQATRSTAGTPLPVRIVAFRSDKEYLPFRINEGGQAFYLGGRDRDYIVMQRITREYFPAAVHEYMHLVMKHSGLDPPLWLNEGLADLFSTLKPIGREVQVGEIIPGRLHAFREGKWLDLKTLFEVDHSSPHYNEKDRMSVFYSQSWVLAHMLFLSDQYRPKFVELMSELASGTGPEAAFQRAYGKPMAAVQKDMERYLLNDRFNVVLYPIKLERSAEKAEGREATALESGLALASLLALVRKPAEARERYLSLAGSNPNNWEVEEGLGYLEWQSGALEEARRRFARAAELGSTNPKMYFDYAALSYGASDQDSVVSALKRAVELKPDYKEAHYRLGFALYAQRRYGEALSAMAHVQKVTPQEAFEFFQVMALILDRLDVRERAIVAAGRARQHASTPAEVDLAERLVQYVSREKWVATQVSPAPVAVAGEREPPRLARRPPIEEPDKSRMRVVVRRETTFVMGLLRQVDCLDKMARIRLDVDGKEMAFLISDPRRVVITGSDQDTVEFNCGPQPPRRLLLEFEPQEDAKLGTQGIVASIEFKELRRRP